MSRVTDIPTGLEQHGVDQQRTGLGLVPLKAVSNLLALLLTLLLVRLGRRFQLVEMACAFLLQLLHDALQLFLLLIEFLLVAGDSLLQAGEGRGWILHLDKGRNIGLCGAVVLDGHVHGQLMGRLQRQLCVAQVAFSAVCAVITLDAQEVDLVNQRLADAVGEYRAFHQIVKG
ncbi:hypothetical protein D9M68_649030 [compost metagenome]